MDIMELGAIGELVGGVAVLTTLIYLALQVKQGNRVARAQVHQDSSRMSTELSLSLDREMLIPQRQTCLRGPYPPTGRRHPRGHHGTRGD